MAQWGRTNYDQFKRLQAKINQLQRVEYQAFCEACAKELAARLLAKVIKRTPVGKYPKGSGKMGGTLRRGWTAHTEQEAKAGTSANAKAWADSLSVSYKNGVYEIEIINPVSYASYVEYGHRTRSHKGWVKGRFMLTISEQELQTQSPKILESKLQKYLGGMFNG